MLKKIKIHLPSIIVAVIANLLIAGVLFVSASWQAPLSAPPTCNSGSPGCDAPVNVGSGAQLKTGTFGVNSVFRAFSDVFIGPTPSGAWGSVFSQAQRLKVNGNVYAKGSFTPDTQKICSAVHPGNWRDSIWAPANWSTCSCMNFAWQTAAPNYQLGCIVGGDIGGGSSWGSLGTTPPRVYGPPLGCPPESVGGVSAGSPLNNCGW